MSVFKGSRYEGSDFTGITGSDGRTRKFVHFREGLRLTDISPSWFVHTVAAGDQLDSLSYAYSGEDVKKAQLWWMVAEVNDLIWPLDVDTGTDLVVPIKELQSKGVGR